MNPAFAASTLPVSTTQFHGHTTLRVSSRPTYITSRHRAARMLGDDTLSGDGDAQAVPSPAPQEASRPASSPIAPKMPSSIASEGENVTSAEAAQPPPGDTSFFSASALGDMPEEDDIELDESELEPLDPPAAWTNKQTIIEAQQKFKIHETDTGSPEFQIATLTTRIKYLTNHLKENPKDYSTARGLLKMVSTRRRLLKYVKKEDPKRFDNIVAGLNIRVSQKLRQL
ncbi:30S ribosomal protein S15 [Gracilariopsis chorda]|uniref:30S ribosomal protein S15 n=1 Tax=Gracilariopsis chorda TaxID=448386 RepID=A0A2V3IMK0_9FLOR|nr:30S ribosomal protein S15 [Gracilariopsis chorda]|eukprot:PXF43303.1 30S ribosomal protein S15 [Gracilariopsis chorda]